MPERIWKSRRNRKFSQNEFSIFTWFHSSVVHTKHRFYTNSPHACHVTRDMLYCSGQQAACEIRDAVLYKYINNRMCKFLIIEIGSQSRPYGGVSSLKVRITIYKLTINDFSFLRLHSN